MRVLFVAWALLAALTACVISGTARQLRSSVPYADEPTFVIKELNYTYPSPYLSIRKINFRTDFTIHLEGNPTGVLLEGGNFVQNLPELHYELDLDKVHYLTSPNGSGPEYAVLLLYEHSGGGIFFHEGIAQVLELSNRQLRVVQEISADAAGNNFVNDRTK